MPGVPLRKGSSFQAFLIGDRVLQAKMSKPLRFVAFTNIGFLIFIVGQGILSLFKAQWEQRKVRNWIFRTLTGRNDYSIPSDIKSKLRFFFAKSAAVAFYLTDVFATIVSPVVFISSVITNELSARVYPVSEKSDAVGQVRTKAISDYVSLFLNFRT